MSEPPEWTIPALKEYVLRMFTDRDKSVGLLYKELEDRIEDIRREMDRLIEKEGQSFKRAEHNAFAERVMIDQERFRQELRARDKPHWDVWIAAGALCVTVIGALWFLAVTPLNETDHRIILDIQRLQETVAKHDQHINSDINHLKGKP